MTWSKDILFSQSPLQKGLTAKGWHWAAVPRADRLRFSFLKGNLGSMSVNYLYLLDSLLHIHTENQSSRIPVGFFSWRNLIRISLVR